MYTGPIETFQGVMIYRNCDSREHPGLTFRCTIPRPLTEDWELHAATIEEMRIKIQRMQNFLRQQPPEIVS